MTNLKLALLGAIGTAGMVLTAAPAAAVTVVANFDGNNGTFNRLVTPGGAFSDDVTFTFASAGIASFDVTSILTSSDTTTNLDFTSVTLNNVIPFTIASTGDRESRFLLNVAVTQGTNFIRLVGASGGNASYSGTIAFAPTAAAVPEPATWGMMLLGFGVIGAGLRRRRTTAVTA